MRTSLPFLLVLVLLCIGPGVFAAPIAVTVLCDEGYPPYSYGEEGQARGLYSDILRAAFALMPAYQVRIRPVPWRRGLAELERGTAFALYPPYHRPERTYMDYSRPILAEEIVLFTSAKLARSRRIEAFPQAYGGLRIGLNDGFNVVRAPLFQTMLEKHELTVSYARDNRSNLLKLSHGRIDAYINDRLSILWTLQLLRQAGELSATEVGALVEGPTLSAEQGYLGFTNRDAGRFAYKADFILAFNAALMRLESAGEIERLTARYGIDPSP